MPLDYTNPATLRFLIENIDKENGRRMIWFNKNKEKLIECASFPENYKDIRTEDVGKVAITKCLPSFSKIFQENRVNHLKKPFTELSILKPKEVKEEPLMHPVEKNVSNILQDGLPFGGRCEYLKVRKSKMPEEKYNFCQTSNNTVGWRLKDSYFSWQAPKYGRYAAFRRDIISRSGPQPDPDYYQTPSNEPYSKCIST